MPMLLLATGADVEITVVIIAEFGTLEAVDAAV
jgi:hypothetical protein